SPPPSSPRVGSPSPYAPRSEVHWTQRRCADAPWCRRAGFPRIEALGDGPAPQRQLRIRFRTSKGTAGAGLDRSSFPPCRHAFPAKSTNALPRSIRSSKEFYLERSRAPQERMSQIRVALVTEYYYPHFGGVTEHVHHLATHLRRRGHFAAVVTSHVPG